MNFDPSNDPSDDNDNDAAGKSLAEVISELRERIVKQVLTPGQRLVER